MDPSADLMRLQQAAEAWVTDRLEEDRSFEPFALALLADGDIALAVDGDGLEASAAIQHIVDGLRGRRGELVGVAICADTRVVDTGDDAVMMALEHEDELVLQLVLPYHLVDGKVEFAPASIGRGTRRIWVDAEG